MISTTTEDGLEAWGHPTRVTPEQRALWSKMSDRWNRFVGDIPSPSMDLGAGVSKGRTVSVDPFPRRHVDVRALGENLPFGNRIFASVVLESVLKHVLSLKDTLAEAQRVTSNDGWLFVTLPVNRIDGHRHSFSTACFTASTKERKNSVLLWSSIANSLECIPMVFLSS